jgi:hypothetical protein
LVNGTLELHDAADTELGNRTIASTASAAATLFIGAASLAPVPNSL